VTDNPEYNQNNSYAGGGSGPMGGYENKPQTVPAEQMWYQEVARGFVDEFTGVPNSIPSSFNSEEEIVFSKTFTLPDGILDDRNTVLIIMLINQADRRIINAVQLPLGENEINGIEQLKTMATESTAPVFDLQGRRVNGTLVKGIYVCNGHKFVVK